jgi:hypothetical protein
MTRMRPRDSRVHSDLIRVILQLDGPGVVENPGLTLQYLEIFNEADRGEGQLNHISFYTDDAGQMREYLASRGVRVPDKEWPYRRDCRIPTR